MEKVLGKELLTSAEIRQRQELERESQQQVFSTKDVVFDALPQPSLEASASSLNHADDAVDN